MLNDLRFTVRLLLKSPGFAAAAIALGIGANTAVLSLANARVAGLHALAAILYRVSPQDFLTFGLVAVALGTIALVASYIPAARVMRADPMIALSHNA